LGATASVCKVESFLVQPISFREIGVCFQFQV